MGERLPAPEEVRSAFAALRAKDAERAVRYLHDLGVASGYLDEAAAARAVRWTAVSPYGRLECSINLAKPEKDPRDIAAAARAAAPPADARVPRCDLCWENEGFPGAPGHPAKPGLRIAAIELGGERWGLQFSPYGYFPEHCIALAPEHRPMKVDAACVGRLLDFVDLFPFYFAGSNADLPIVGGSILSHDHFQGGRHVFPLMRAPVERAFELPGEPAVRCGAVRWPASVVRLAAADRRALERAAARTMEAWRGFSCEACGIAAASGGVAHNAVSPIARKTEKGYVLDLVLRNNRADAAHPWGVFHPGEDLHHIKRENIGLIEAMGLAVLPARLARELPAVQRALGHARSADDLRERLLSDPLAAPHAPWALERLAGHAAKFACGPGGEGSFHPVVKREVARVFVSVLEAVGVFKRTPAGRAGWDAFARELCRVG